MWRVTLRDLTHNKLRVISTALSVIIGIAFLAGSFVFTDTIGRTFDNLFADVNKETDAYVRSTHSIEGEFGFIVRDRIPDSMMGQVAALPEVSAVSGEVQGFATILGKDGKAIGNPDTGAPTFAGDLTDSPLTPWKLTDGSKFPTGPDEVVIDNGSAKDGDYAIGDTVTVASQDGTRQFTLVGTAKFGNTDSPGGATFALFDLPTVQSFVGKPGEIDAVRAKAVDGVSQEELAAAIRSVVGSDIEVLTGAEITKENQDDLAEGLQFFNILLTVFATIALFVSAFIIYNTFSILVAQRQRETALLRALGAGRGQVLRSIIAESFVVGLVASALGLLSGIAIANLMKALFTAIGIDLPAGGTVLLPRTVIASLLVGVIVTVVSAIGPALRASRVPPVAAMRDMALDRSGTSTARLLSGLVIAGLGAAGIIAGLTGTGIQWLGLGVALLFIGVFVLGPLIARPVARIVGWPIARGRGVTGYLARENAMRNPKRTARTAAALMVGVSLVAGISVLAASIKSSVRNIFSEQLAGDYVVQAESQGYGGLSTKLAAELNDLPEVEAAAGVQNGLANVDGDDRLVTVVDPVPASEVFDLDFIDGSLGDLTDEGVEISKEEADDEDLSIGDTVTMTFANGEEHDLTVQGIYDKDELAGAYTISRGLYATSDADQYDFGVYIKVADGVSDADARAAISKVTDRFSNGELKSRSEYIDDQAKQIDGFVMFIYLLLGLAVIIAALGIANTLRLSILERTREIGLMRAVGTTRQQMRSIVRWESIITAVLGTVQGIVIGVGLGYAVIVALRDEGLSKFTLPVVPLVVLLVVAMLLGTLAAIFPAHRASKLNVLEAISHS